MFGQMFSYQNRIVDLLGRSWIEISIISPPSYTRIVDLLGRSWIEITGTFLIFPVAFPSTSSGGRGLKYISEIVIVLILCRPPREVVD